MTADACHKPVIAGPVEATAMGNLLTQVRASREVGSLAQMRAVVHASTPLKRYEPRDAPVWREALGRFVAMTA